jgi:general secretion pathway protein D
MIPPPPFPAIRSRRPGSPFAWCLALAVAAAPCVQAGPADAGQPAPEARQQALAAQQERLQQAWQLLQAGRHAEALERFASLHAALSAPGGDPELLTLAREGYVRAGLARAGELAGAGDPRGAAALLDQLDAPAVSKQDPRVAAMRRRLTDPDRYPPALTPEHIQRVEDVSRRFTLAASQTETGQFDAAIAGYEEILRIDPTNSAARRGLEQVEKQRALYFEAAKDHQRARMLNQVNAAWENPPAATNLSALFGAPEGQGQALGAARGGRETIQRKLRELVIAQVDFSEATLGEVMEYLRVRTRDLDPAGKGLDFVNSVPADQPLKPISLNLREVPVEEVLRYVADIAGITYKVEEFAVRLVSLADASADIISRTYRVPPDFISSAPAAGAAPASADPFAASATTAASPQLRRLGAKEFLESQGVGFPEGTGASYNPSSSTLIVRNSAKNLELVDMLVEQAFNRSPRQVVIEVKMLEVRDNRLKEVGFDWLLGAWGGEVQGAGGTAGNAQPNTYLTQDFPRQVATAAGTTALGFNPVTAGLRSGGNLPGDSVDALLESTLNSSPISSSRSPGVFSVSGVLTSPQFQTVIRALDQKKGIDVAAQPAVVTRSGQKASIEITRELIYPTEFDPPQVPTNVGANQILIVNGVRVPIPLPPPVVTPTTPTAFDMRRTGVVLEVEPVISEDGRMVDLALTPEFTEFSGFVNYGTPIFGVFEGNYNLLTDNFIYQPVFDTKKVVTAVNIYDGATVVLGGLVSDNTIVMQDKVPLIGDAPYVGRLFRSEVTRRQMKHVLFFVTVKVVDPSGRRINEP